MSLGRGLAALIPDSTFEDDSDPVYQAGRTFRHVPIDEIQANPDQPRAYFEPQALAELSESIQTHGILTPLVVRRVDGRYLLIAGERRLRAAALAGLQEVPVVVRDTEGAAEPLELALVENLQRQDLDAIEEAQGFKRLVEDFGFTQDQVARRVGRSRVAIANAIRLLKLPHEALQSIRLGEFSAGHGRALLPLVGTPHLQSAMAKVVQSGLNVRATERLVRRVVAEQKASGSDDRSDATLSYATSALSYSLHTKVEIRPRRKGGGRIVIDYADTEDLERLIGLLRG